MIRLTLIDQPVCDAAVLGALQTVAMMRRVPTSSVALRAPAIAALTETVEPAHVSRCNLYIMFAGVNVLGTG